LFLLAIISALSAVAFTAANPSPAFAQDDTEQLQCLSREQCRALRQEVREYKRELRPMRRERRELQRQIRETPAGEERDRLIAQARELHREVKQLKRENRPTARRFRAGCRPDCFPDRT
jgi:seryl-tRNA synthetase